MKRPNLDRLANRFIRSADRAIRAVDQTLKAVAQPEARMRALTQRPIRLSKRDTENLLRVLANQTKKNQPLRRAAAAYMKRVHF